MISNAPAPPLPSFPFTGSDIKPKKIAYFWTGAGDNQHTGMQEHRVIPPVC
jgi:selenium-binding protein 1